MRNEFKAIFDITSILNRTPYIPQSLTITHRRYNCAGRGFNVSVFGTVHDGTFSAGVHKMHSMNKCIYCIYILKVVWFFAVDAGIF